MDTTPTTIDYDKVPDTWAPVLMVAKSQGRMPADLLPLLDADWLRDWATEVQENGPMAEAEMPTYPEYIACVHRAYVDDFTSRDLWDGDTLRAIASLADEMSKLIGIGCEL